MAIDRPIDRLPSGIPLGAAAIAPLIYLRSASDSTALPKMTFILIAGVAAVIVIAVRAATGRRCVVPHGWPPALAGFFILVALVAALTAPVPWYAWIGQEQRAVGLLLYAACVVLFLAASAFWRLAHLRLLVVALGAGGLLLALYGFLQAAGIDPLNWASAPSPVFATLGNSNFFSGYLGILVPLLAAQALEGSAIRRIAFGTAAALLCGAIVVSQSVQGVFAAGAGLVVVLAAWLRTHPGAASRHALRALLVATVLAAAFGLMGLARVGPLAPVMEIGTLDTRQWYWTAGVEMGLDHPVLGVGLGQYADHFRRYRPIEASRILGSAETADSPHSVPIAMFAEGGVLLVTAYLAFVLAIGWRLIGAIRRANTEGQLLLLGGYGGAWLAYQAQSAVSIEMPSLVLVHFILAAAIVVLSGGAGREVSWGARGSRRRRSPSLAIVGVSLALGVVLVWMSTAPLRAVRLATQGRAYSEAGLYGEALGRLQAAVALTPSNPAIHAERARAFGRAKRLDLALAAYRDALELAPRDLPYTLTAARLAKRLERADAAELYRHVVVLEPASPEILVEAATYFADHGDVARARQLARRAQEIDPSRSDVAALLDRLG